MVKQTNNQINNIRQQYYSHTITFWILKSRTKWSFSTLEKKEMVLCYKHKKELSKLWGLFAFIPVQS